MNTQTNPQNTTKTMQRRRLNVPFLNIQEVGAVTGKIKGNFKVRHSKTWEADFITTEFETIDGETVQLVLDGGLRGALKLTGIIEGDVETDDKMIDSHTLSVLKPDMLIEIEFAGKVEVANGKANQYNVYELIA